MRSKDLIPLYRQLMSSMPGFSFHKRLLLQTPIGGVLRAIHFDTTGLDKNGMNIDVFVMAMCFPSDGLHLTFGRRVDHPTKVWTMDMPNLADNVLVAIKEQALPFLARAHSLSGFADLVSRFSGNPHAPKEIAFALARAGEDERAIATIDDYLPKLAPNVVWERAIAEESRSLRDMLIADADAAHRQLEKWENETIQKLGLERFR